MENIRYEFLIKPLDCEWFDVHKNEEGVVVRPKLFAWKNEDYGMFTCEGSDVVFSFEDPGVQLIMHNGDFPPAKAMKIACDIATGIARHTGSRAEVFLLTWPDEFDTTDEELPTSVVITPQ